LGADGEEHSLFVEQDRVVLAEGGRTTPIVMTPPLDDHTTLYLRDGRPLEIDQEGLQIGRSLASRFAVQSDSSDPKRFHLRAGNGRYLAAPDLGKPISFGAHPGPATAFRATHDVRFRPLWEAEEGAWNDESRSTHLWIFNRAVELIKNNNGLSPNQAGLLSLLANETFVNNVKRGIDAADNEGGLFGEYSSGGTAYPYLAHFFNPKTRRSYATFGPDHINALNWGSKYFRIWAAAAENPNTTDIASFGKNLGLAIHYLEDLTQPMHSGLWINNPADPTGIVGMRHEEYEKWTLKIQNQCRLNSSEIKLNDLPQGLEILFAFTASKSLEVFEGWVGHALSPIGYFSHFASDADWLPDASGMLKLAQRVVMSLLLSTPIRAKLPAPPRLKTMTACQQGGQRGAVFWGVDQQGVLRCTYQETAGGGWSGWSDEWNGASPRDITALTAAQQGDGRVALWALTPDGALRCNYQTSAGGDWAGWSGPDWSSAPKLRHICACQLGGSGGAALWGVDQQGILRAVSQQTAGGGWSAWAGEWDGASPRDITALTAAQQGDGSVALWALTPDGALRSNYQTSAGGNWAGWSDPGRVSAPTLRHICACQLGGSHGAALWGVDQQGILRAISQETPGGVWSPWSGEWDGASPRDITALTAAQQGDERALWALTPDGVLHSNYQTSAGGSWHGWSS
jgi:hypothetical protein